MKQLQTHISACILILTFTLMDLEYANAPYSKTQTVITDNVLLLLVGQFKIYQAIIRVFCCL